MQLTSLHHGNNFCTTVEKIKISLQISRIYQMNQIFDWYALANKKCCPIRFYSDNISLTIVKSLANLLTHVSSLSGYVNNTTDVPVGTGFTT